MPTLFELVRFYFTAHPRGKADTRARVAAVVHAAARVPVLTALLPLTPLGIAEGYAENELPLFGVMPIADDGAGPVVSFAPKPGSKLNTWQALDMMAELANQPVAVFSKDLVPALDQQTNIESITYTSGSSGSSTAPLLVRFHRLTNFTRDWWTDKSTTDALITELTRAQRKFRELSDQEVALVAQLKTLQQQGNAAGAKNMFAQVNAVRAQNSNMWTRRVNIVLDSLTLLLQSGALDMGTVEPLPTRLQRVLDKVQGCPSFQPVVSYYVDTDAHNMPRLNMVVPALPGNLKPLTELVKTAGTTMDEAARLQYILLLARHFNDFLVCLNQRNVVWVAPRWAAVYAAFDRDKHIDYLVAPGTQIVNMFAVAQFVPAPPRRRAVLEEFVAEVWFAFAGVEWDMNVNALTAYDFHKLAATTPKAATGLQGARAEFVEALNSFMNQL